MTHDPAKTTNEWVRQTNKDIQVLKRQNYGPTLGTLTGSLRYGTIDTPWSTGPAPVTLSDGITHITAFVGPSDPDAVPGALVSVRQISPGVWVVERAYGSPTFPRWVDLTLATGWTYQTRLITFATSNGGSDDAPYHKVQVTKTTGNFVDVAGTIIQGASATTLITTLPVGYRPLTEHYFIVATISTGGVLSSTGVKVLPDGTVNLQALLGTGAQVFLDGINFTNDASLVWTTLASVGYLNSWADTGGVGVPVGAITVDSNFRVFLRGKVKRTAATAGLNQMTNALGSTFRIDNAAGSAGNILRGLDPGVRVTRFDIIGAGSLQDTAGGFTDTALDLSSSWISQNYPGVWTSPTFFNGPDYGNNYPVRAYTKTPDQMVQWRGLIASNTGGKVVNNLPEGYRPAGVRGFSILSNGVAGLYYIGPDGVVYFNSGSTWEELNQIRFVAEK